MDAFDLRFTVNTDVIAPKLTSITPGCNSVSFDPTGSSSSVVVHMVFDEAITIADGSKKIAINLGTEEMVRAGSLSW